MASSSTGSSRTPAGRWSSARWSRRKQTRQRQSGGRAGLSRLPSGQPQVGSSTGVERSRVRMTGVRSAVVRPGGSSTRSSRGRFQAIRSVPSLARTSCWANPMERSTKVTLVGITFLNPLEVNWANLAGRVASPRQ